MLNDQLAQISGKIDTMLNKINAIEVEIASLKTQFRHFEKRVDRLEKDIDRHETDLRNLNRFVWSTVGGLAVLQIILQIFF